MTEPGTTLERTLRPGRSESAGAQRPYRKLAYGPGEPRLRREELAPSPPAGAGPGSSLLRLAHVTDFQVADVQSPARFEFCERLRGLSGSENYVPACRPQESMAPHAVAAMVRTLNSLPPSAETGAELDLALCTGDTLDNAQQNELGWSVAILAGGVAALGSGGPGYEGVQSIGWEPALYWSPEPGPDPYKERFGYPSRPGLLGEALGPLGSPGLAVPWLACFGNHDGLALGTAIATPAYEQVLLGALKPVDLPPGLDPMALIEAFISHPELLLAGHSRPVRPDAERRSVARRELVSALLAAGGRPAGHGYRKENLERGTAYAVYDLDGPVPLRVVLLDTVDLDGGFQGSIGLRQLRWLEERLSEAHSRAYDAAGRLVGTGGADRLVVLASHHGLASMVNGREDPGGLETDHPRVLARELEELLHRFPNVVLWLNGHRHRNEVRPRPDPSGRSGGFWEVSTAALADWPCQGRLVELTCDAEGELTILSTMLDSAVPPDPAEAAGAGADTVVQLAAFHRELASNDPFSGAGTGGEGSPGDRNVALRVPAPFPLR